MNVADFIITVAAFIVIIPFMVLMVTGTVSIIKEFIEDLLTTNKDN